MLVEGALPVEEPAAEETVQAEEGPPAAQEPAAPPPQAQTPAKSAPSSTATRMKTYVNFHVIPTTRTHQSSNLPPPKIPPALACFAISQNLPFPPLISSSNPPPQKKTFQPNPPSPPLKTALRPNAAMRQMHPRRHPLGARRPHLLLRRPERRAGRRFLRRRVRVRLCARRGGWGDWGNRRGLIEIVDWGGGLERRGTGKFGGGSGRENGVSLMLVIGWLVRTYDPFTYLSILSILLSPISHIPRSFIRFHKI